jgi:hypothetical protein
MEWTFVHTTTNVFSVHFLYKKRNVDFGEQEMIFLLLHCSSHGPRESQFWLTETLFSCQIPFSVWLIIRKQREMIRKQKEIDSASRDMQIS